MKIFKFAGLLGGLTTFAALGGGPPTNAVALTWSPSIDSNVAGYHLYQGVASQEYTNIIDVGPALTNTVSGLAPGVTYFFAVTAYDMIGLESLFSNEISYQAPSAGSLLQIGRSSTGEIQLSGSAPSGFAYQLLASQDLTNWVPIGGVTSDASGLFQFIDPGAVTNASRFYRLQPSAL